MYVAVLSPTNQKCLHQILLGTWMKLLTLSWVSTKMSTIHEYIILSFNPATINSLKRMTSAEKMIS